MTRVSLKEAYDNKDVVAQIYAIRDIAEGAEGTANSALSTANTASEHVDALVPQVEGAVQNANNASASAQASAQTVAGYENRLSDVELRVTTVEGNIVTIQGRITALETADGQNVKLSGDQNISGIKTVPTETTGTRSQQIANSEKVGAELDNYESMVRTTGNQMIAGVKSFSNIMLGDNVIFEGGTVSAISSTARTNYCNVLEITPSLRNHYRIAILGGLNNNSIVSAEIEIVFGTDTAVNYVLVHNKSTNAGRAIKIKITRSTGNKIRLWVLEGQFIVYRAYVLRVSDAGTIKYSNTFTVPGTILSDPTTESDYQDTVTALDYVDYPIE